MNKPDFYTPPTPQEVDAINQTKRSELVAHKMLGTKPQTPKSIKDDKEIRLYELEHICPPSECLEVAKHHLKNAKDQNKIPTWAASGDLRKLFKIRSDLIQKERRMAPAIHALYLSKHPNADAIYELYAVWREKLYWGYNNIEIALAKNQSSAQKKATDNLLVVVFETEVETFNKVHEQIMRLIS